VEHDNGKQRFAHTEGDCEGHGGQQRDERGRDGDSEQFEYAAANSLDNFAGEWGNGFGDHHGVGNRLKQFGRG